MVFSGANIDVCVPVVCWLCVATVLIFTDCQASSAGKACLLGTCQSCTFRRSCSDRAAALVLPQSPEAIAKEFADAMAARAARLVRWCRRRCAVLLVSEQRTRDPFLFLCLYLPYSASCVQAAAELSQLMPHVVGHPVFVVVVADGVAMNLVACVWL